MHRSVHLVSDRFAVRSASIIQMGSNLIRFDDRFIPHHKIFMRDIYFDLVISEIVDLPAAVVGKGKDPGLRSQKK